MKLFTFIYFFMVCFLSSEVLQAAQEDKKEVSEAKKRWWQVAEMHDEAHEASFPKEIIEEKKKRPASAPPKFSEEKNEPIPVMTMPLMFAPLKAARPFGMQSVEGDEEQTEDEEAQDKERSSRDSIKGLIAGLLTNPDTLKGVLHLSLNSFPLEVIKEFGQFSKIHTLSLENMMFQQKEVGSLLAESLSEFPDLRKLTILKSSNLNTFLFFLGIKLPKMTQVKEIVMEGNQLNALGVKSFFYGLTEMSELEKFSWRHMPFDSPMLWEEEYIRKLEGYRIQKRARENKDGTSENISYVVKTPLQFLIDEVFPYMPHLSHLDLGGSIALGMGHYSFAKMKKLFEALSELYQLRSLGVAKIKGDRFVVNLLSKALVGLAERQSLHSTGLEILDVSRVIGEGTSLGALKEGLKALHLLKQLNLAGNNLSNRDVPQLKNIFSSLHKLSVLDLKDNPNLTDQSFIQELEARGVKVMI